MTNMCIIGIGRVGLPLALVFAEKGFKVIGADIDEARLEKIRQGKMPFIEENAEELLRKNINNNFEVTSNVREAVKKSTVIILTLGTPVDEHMNPVYSQIEKVLETIIPELKENDLLILRSTVSPKTTEYLKKYIEKNTNFKVGENFFLAYCPERIAEGKSIEELKELPQIIGTLDEKSKEKAKEIFDTISPKTLCSDSRSAELAKLYSNMYRYINFAIANEFMIIADKHERDIYEVVNLVNNGYKRGGVKQPGLAAGPCLYKDGFFLVNKIPFPDLITTAWKVNESIPAYLFESVKDKIPSTGGKAAILGLSFKKNIDDKRNSLSFKLKKIIEQEGIDFFVHDPYLTPTVNLNEKLKDVDVVFFAINHDTYKEIGLEGLKKMLKPSAIICDIWNLFNTGKIIFKISDY